MKKSTGRILNQRTTFRQGQKRGGALTNSLTVTRGERKPTRLKGNKWVEGRKENAAAEEQALASVGKGRGDTPVLTFQLKNVSDLTVWKRQTAGILKQRKKTFTPLRAHKQEIT